MPLRPVPSRARRSGALLLSTVLVASLTSIVAKPASAAPEAGAAQNPIFLTGPNEGSPEEIAIRYLRTNPTPHGVTTADLADLAVLSSYTSRHNGVTHVNLTQRHRELEVFGATATVNIARDGSVVFVGDTLVSGLSGNASGTADLDAVQAVEAAAEALDLADPASPRVMSRAGGPAQRTVVSGSGISDEPIPAKLGWQPTGDGLRLAWQLVIDDASDVHLWNATVDAETGDLLGADDWTTQENVAELSTTLGHVSGRGLAHRHNHNHNHGHGHGGKLGTPDPVQDGSAYRVYGYPTESPNDGPRRLVTNPADGLASPYGWHDTDGAPGPEFTTTQGNNVHAYQDQDNNNAADFGSSPDGGPSLNFDFPLDLTENPQSYRDAATANLFYWNNIIHDVSYRYGFDEASGNFQANNYGRGGVGGDYVHAEAADGGGTNNANFSTPAVDGVGTPRMQMYLWPGNQFGAQNQVVLDGVGSFDAGWARYSPAPTNAGLPGRQFVYAGTGCATAAYPDSLPAGGWIAVVDGGTTACTYLLRTQVAESLGADAVVVAHNAAGAAPVLTGAMTTAPVTIAAVAVTQADGAAIKAAIADGTVTGSVRKHPDHPGMRDGDLDAGIVIHEYGHGISNRLTGGPGINCLSGNEQMGEGWSDYFAVTTLLDPRLDTADGSRGLVPYILYQDDRSGAGLRPRPYSRNMQIQPFTYDSIKTGGWLDGATLAAPHGIGHGWAAVLWDVTWDLIDRHGLNPNVYGPWHSGGNNLSMQLVMDGLKLQGCGPGFVVGRDAIIAADAALTGGDNACTLWASFARRGLGYSAVQGTTNRDDNTEAFDTHPSCQGDFDGRSAQPALNRAKAGSAAPMTFTLAANRGLDILASGSPYSRLVDCDTLETVNPDGSITPRPVPVPAVNPGRSKLSANAKGRYNYVWKTDPSWAGTCREFVLTLDDGFQFRAYFRFTG
ncbi:M36 family metallopeptidase [Micromonospora sp. WMMD1082]|uniref:M36 family metallopeptidase n=1 Tax=Micromonospora sp. WMMD1082 TaxID=3016104 RepID=UPI002415EB9A|nr:M36 family metallopeptidase [Micromonospora sp. WMMD1082]MDG4798148.1 M36 family metallopeptidase [Micromonospora sp. WMMD1082]